VFFLSLQKEIMKKIIAAVLLVSGLYSCESTLGQDSQFGTKIDDKGAISMSELITKMKDSEKVEAKVEGKVVSVCQAKGCWMTIDKGDGTTMRVSFKDYAFFVPKNIAGKTVVMQGTAEVTTTSVAELKHYAEDAKKSDAEIESIKEPARDMTFEAEGVLIK
jgi:hypothetical protein